MRGMGSSMTTHWRAPVVWITRWVERRTLTRCKHRERLARCKHKALAVMCRAFHSVAFSLMSFYLLHWKNNPLLKWGCLYFLFYTCTPQHVAHNGASLFQQVDAFFVLLSLCCFCFFYSVLNLCTQSTINPSSVKVSPRCMCYPLLQHIHSAYPSSFWWCFWSIQYHELKQIVVMNVSSLQSAILFPSLTPFFKYMFFYFTIPHTLWSSPEAWAWN